MDRGGDRGGRCRLEWRRAASKEVRKIAVRLRGEGEKKLALDPVKKELPRCTKLENKKRTASTFVRKKRWKEDGRRDDEDDEFEREERQRRRMEKKIW